MSRRLYLGRVDIGLDSKLELRRADGEATDKDVLAYLFCYGLIADQVFMQGSASLKSKQVQSAYLCLFEAFRRNENHEPTPVFVLALDEDVDGYAEYFLDRSIILRTMGADNAERNAYLQSDALRAAKQLDADLSATRVPRRQKSVGKAFRDGLLGVLRSKDVESTGLTKETADKAIRKIDQTETLQTFNLIKTLNLAEVEQISALYDVARERYRKANAYGVDALNSDDSPIWNFSTIKKFLTAIGLRRHLATLPGLSSESLFKIRRIPAFRELREEYFLCQSENDTHVLVELLQTLRVDGRIRSAVRQSPGALAALLFEALTENGIGYKALNKSAELLTKSVLSDAADEYFGQRCYRLFGMIEQLERELQEFVIRQSLAPRGVG